MRSLYRLRDEGHEITIEQKRAAISKEYGKYYEVGHSVYKSNSNETMLKVHEIMNEGNWDHSDSQSDYFAYGWRAIIKFGRKHYGKKEDQPYVYTRPEVLEARALDKVIKVPKSKVTDNKNNKVYARAL